MNIKTNNMNTQLEIYLDLLNKFETVSIGFSIDDVENRNAYIRANSDWDLTISNLKRFLNEYPSFWYNIAQTVMAYNFLYVEELFLFLDKHNLIPNMGIKLNHIHAPNYLNANVLPLNVRRQKIDEIKNILPKYMYENLYGHYYNAEQLPKWDEFINTTIEVDKVRNQNYLDFFSKLNMPNK